jgi:hypothetical protein
LTADQQVRIVDAVAAFAESRIEPLRMEVVGT